MRYGALAAVCILGLGATLRQSSSDAIGVVDMGRAISEYAKWQDMQKVLQDRRLARRKEIDAIASEVVKLREELEKIDPDATEFVRKQGLLIQKEALWETTSQQYEIELNRSEETQYDALVDEVIAAVGDLAKELGLTAVIQRALETPEGVWDSVLYADPSIDLTDRLVDKLNKKYSVEKRWRDAGAGKK